MVFQINEIELNIINYMRNNGENNYHKPTDIGEQVGKKDYNQSSSWACRKLFKMKDKGIIRRNKKGHYKLLSVFLDGNFHLINKKLTLSFNEYQNLTHKYFIKDGIGKYDRDLVICRFVLGLCEESGEVAGKVKKYLRGDYKNINKEEIEKELGDILWYLSELSSILKIDLNDVATKNIQKLEDRRLRNKIRGNGDLR